MSYGVIKFPDNSDVGGYANKNFVQLEFPWLNAKISARSKEDKEEKILKNKNIKTQKSERVEITKLFKLRKEIKMFKNNQNLSIKEVNARRNFRKHAAIRQTSFAQIPPSAELRIPAKA